MSERKKVFLAELPKKHELYPKLLQKLVWHKLDKQNISPRVLQLPNVEYIVKNINIDPVHLAKYKKVCKLPSNGIVPSSYFSMLSLYLHVHMMLQDDFPFSAMGLVHIRNHTKQYRPVLVNENIQMNCSFGELIPHEKGVAFECMTQIYVGDELVMELEKRLLVVDKALKLDIESPQITSIQTKHIPQFECKQTWSLPECLGRQYALVSGDVNLIHLHALTAKVFGFKQPVAHGLYLKARILGVLSPFSRAYEFEVNFKSPTYLPSKVDFMQDTIDDLHCQFAIMNHETKRVHVVGELKNL